jgi:type II secretory pathway component PulF
MTLFSYKALRADGSVMAGQLEAGGRQEAFAALDRQGLRPIDLLDGAVAAGAAQERHGRPGRVTAKALEAFTRQLASLLAASVPLSQALHLLSRESADRAGRAQWHAIHDEVIDGTPLAQAMSHHPQVFPNVYCAMVKAGETGGFLDLVLRQIAEFQSRERELRSKVLGALIYPAVLSVLSVGVLVFLLVFFIPRFQGIFNDFGGALPPLTRGIVTASELLRRHGPLLLLGIGVVVLLLRRYLATAAGRRHREDIALRLPLVGTVAARFAMTRFCRMLGTLVQAGVPLINALRVARESLGNEILVEAVNTAIDRVQHGDRLGASLSACPRLFPASVVAMVTVAEQSGRLDEELIRLANDTEQDLDRHLRAAVAVAEPALLLVMAGFVGAIVVGMVLPIFAIQDYIK